MNYTQHYSTKKTPQTESIPGRNMKKNSAGGFSFDVDKWTQLDRFLILGSEGGTYYIGQSKLTKDNADDVVRCIKENGVRVVSRIVDISINGRAPKNDPAIFALALAATFGDQKTKNSAYAAIERVCRTGTHIFQFCQSIQDLRNWSRGLRGGVSKYYTNKTPEKLAYHLIKYQQRNGWTHRDVLRLSHPKPANQSMDDLFSYAVGKKYDKEFVPAQLLAAEEIKSEAKRSKVIKLITDNDLPREVVPTQWLKHVEVWEALLESMPVTAMMRNLGKMTSIGLLTSNLSNSTKKIVKTLTDPSVIKKGRVHPLNTLVALKTYAQGKGMKGSLSWSPVAKINDALDKAFYLGFEAVEPTGKNYLLGLDVSGSMSCSISNMPLSCREASAAMAMVTARTEENHEFLAFTSGGFSAPGAGGGGWGGCSVQQMDVSPRQRLDDVVRKMSNYDFGGTDCALPMLWAAAKKVPVDTFIIYTDSETWAGDIHPKQALDQYRQKMGQSAKCIVVGMTSNDFTIADPKDSGMLDVVGFDTSVPNVISSFSKGL